MNNRIFQFNLSGPSGGQTSQRLWLGSVCAGVLALSLCAGASAEVFYTMVEPCDLALVNTDTGTTDVIGSAWGEDVNYNVEALTFGPDGALYATVDDGCGLHGSAYLLATINPGTAEVSVIGPIENTDLEEQYDDIDAIAFSPEGVLYGVAVPGSQLLNIDPDTGEATRIGDGLGEEFGFIGAIEFLRDGTLVGADFGDGGGGPTDLLTINPADGSGTLIGPVEDSGSVGFDSVEGLSLDRAGGLYGMADAVGGGDGTLIEIDPTSGSSTSVQSVETGDNGHLDGLAACSDDSSELVYFSSGDRIMRLSTADCGPLSVLYDAGPNEDLEEFLGLNYGPDQWLYFCARGFVEEGLMGRIDPADPLNTFEILYDSNGTVDGPVEPECGWFTHEGDFMVSDVDNGEIWMFEDLAGNPAAGPVPIADVNNGAGQLTQYINGDLLVVVPNNAGVSSTDFPTFFPGQGPAVPDTLISGLGDAKGIAVSYGYVFVSTGNDVNRYTIDYDALGEDPPVGDLKDGMACTSIGGGYGDPGHLASTINGQIYTGTTEGLLFRINFDPEGGTIGSCAVSGPLFEFEDYPMYQCDYDGDGDIWDCPSITGVAVTETSLSITKTSITGTELFTFNNSNTWEFTPDEPSGTCDATITATLTANETVDTMIASIPEGGESVQCLGDNGFDIVWETNFGDCPLTEDGFYRHLVNCYLPMFNGDANLRIGVNEDLPPDEGTGELMDLTVSIPVNPDLVPVDPVGGRRRRGSHNYWVRVPLATNPADRGEFCGFRPPLNTTMDPDKARTVKIGSTVPVKFRLAEFTGNCKKGPWRTDAQAVLSVAQLDPLAVIFPLSANGVGDEENSWFEPVGKDYKFNLDTTGYGSGLHLLTVTFPNGEAPQAATLINMVH